MKDFNDFSKLTPKRVAKVRHFDLNTSFNVEGVEGGTFAIASSKKELKRLMKSDASVVYYEKRGKLYLNENGEKKGWGAKKGRRLVSNIQKKAAIRRDKLQRHGILLGRFRYLTR